MAGRRRLYGRLARQIVLAVVVMSAAQLTMACSVSSRQPVPWFGGYVDVTVTPPYEFQHASAAGHNVLLSFVVSDMDQPCSPSWGSVYTPAEASDGLGLESRLNGFREAGGNVAVSFGGAINAELATACTDPALLAGAYAEVVDHYDAAVIDLDIEEHNLKDLAAGARRAAAVAQVQEEHDGGAGLGVWLTLPVSPAGLTEEGTLAVSQMLEAGVELSGVNLMTMNYGQSRPTGMSMVDASIQAAQITHSQLNALYRDAGQELDTASLWSKIGLTPLIGQNEVAGDVFTLEDAKALNAFALDQGVGRISMWSLNRDRSCSDGDRAGAGEGPSPHCSGMEQAEGGYAKLLGDGLTGGMF